MAINTATLRGHEKVTTMKIFVDNSENKRKVLGFVGLFHMKSRVVSDPYPGQDGYIVELLTSCITLGQVYPTFFKIEP